MIPRLNENGYLPRGIHKATVQEIKRRFGRGSTQRVELFEGITSVVRLLRRHKGSVRGLLLDGSYVTSKEQPEDFDCIVILGESFDFGSPEAGRLRRAKELFNGHVLAVMETDAGERRRLVEFFGHDRDGKPKGLVEVAL